MSQPLLTTHRLHNFNKTINFIQLYTHVYTYVFDYILSTLKIYHYHSLVLCYHRAFCYINHVVFERKGETVIDHFIFVAFSFVDVSCDKLTPFLKLIRMPCLTKYSSYERLSLMLIKRRPNDVCIFIFHTHLLVWKQIVHFILFFTK